MAKRLVKKLVRDDKLNMTVVEVILTDNPEDEPDESTPEAERLAASGDVNEALKDFGEKLPPNMPNMNLNMPDMDGLFEGVDQMFGGAENVFSSLRKMFDGMRKKKSRKHDRE